MASKKKGLGRGLDALFGDIEIKVPVHADDIEDSTGEKKVSTNANEEDRIHYIDIDAIKPNNMQPRKHFDTEKIEVLSESITMHGLIQPILLRKAGNAYEIVAGERRWRAARKAGLKEIPSVIKKIDDEQNAFFAIIENVQREDLNPIEEAEAYQAIIEEYGFTQENLAKRIGKSRSNISNTMRLLKLDTSVIELIKEGILTGGHGIAIAGLKNKENIEYAVTKICEKKLSVRETEKLVRNISTSKSKLGQRGKPREKTAEIKRIEDEITSILGTKVELNYNGKNGKIEINYYSRDELESFIELFRNLKS